MPAAFADRGTSLCQTTYQATYIILCVIAIGIVSLTFANRAIAADLTVGGYISPAAVLVTMEPLAPVSREVPMELLATGPPSRILLIGKAKMGMRHRLPPQFIVGKTVTNTAGDEIGIVTKVDGAQVVIAVGGYPGAGTYDIELSWDHFTTNDKGEDIKLLTNVSTVALRSLPKHRSLD